MNRLTAAARCGAGSFAELLAGTFRIAKYSPDHRNRVRYLQIAPVSRGDVGLSCPVRSDENLVNWFVGNSNREVRRTSIGHLCAI